MKRMEQIVPKTEEMLDKLARLVRYNSVRGEAKPDMPFGEVPAACLAEALTIAEEMGFATKNVDNYCGYAEMGEGEEIIGIAAHLDIVPAGDGWDTDPFTLTQKGNFVFGRGVSDDKGAAIAALYAMQLLRDSGVKMNKRVRLLLGCNEETGSACMKYYVEHEEPISVGFTPDGTFPGIYGEKGGCAMHFSSKNTKILSMHGGFVSNAVCNRCTTELPLGAVDAQALRNALAATPLISSSVTEAEDKLVVEAQGVAAHASTPLLGVNAAGYTMLALEKAGMQDDFVSFYNKHIGVDCDGAGIGCKIEDEYGPLTLNNGVVRTENGVITGTIDIRYPVTVKPEQLRALAEPHLEDEQGVIVIDHIVEPLFYEPNSDLVRCLHNAYVEITGDTENQPMVIGGGTYAKAVPGIIAFGCEFPGIDNHIHDANERLDITELQQQVAIYAQAILNLMEI